MFITLTIFDGYITSSLGLPRNLRIIGNTSNSIDAPHIESPEMLTAANANAELLEILSTARENIFLTKQPPTSTSSYLTSAAQLRELSTRFDQWAMRYHLLTKANDAAQGTPSK